MQDYILKILLVLVYFEFCVRAIECYYPRRGRIGPYKGPKKRIQPYIHEEYPHEYYDVPYRAYDEPFEPVEPYDGGPYHRPGYQVYHSSVRDNDQYSYEKKSDYLGRPGGLSGRSYDDGIKPDVEIEIESKSKSYYHNPYHQRYPKRNMHHYPPPSPECEEVHGAPYSYKGSPECRYRSTPYVEIGGLNPGFMKGGLFKMVCRYLPINSNEREEPEEKPSGPNDSSSTYYSESSPVKDESESEEYASEENKESGYDDGYGEPVKSSGYYNNPCTTIAGEPLRDGPHPNPDDCTAFVECEYGKKIFDLSCSKDLAYDIRTRSCLPAYTVDCRNRPNPYILIKDL